MCQGGSTQGVQVSYEILCDVINKNEHQPERKQKLLTEIEKFMGPNGNASNGFPVAGLDNKSRDDFQPLFNHLKTFLYDMSSNN
jgi:hypothetical protein